MLCCINKICKIPGIEVGSSQNSSHYMQNSFLLWYFREWISDCKLVLDETLLGSFLLDQKFVKQRLTCSEMMDVKLHTLADQ